MLHGAPPTTAATLSEKAVQDISRALIPLLSDVFALYLKTRTSTGICPARISATII
jgi:hypothetical protein